MSKTAIILFNLGGPDEPKAIQPFLFNLFNDPAIIGAPGPIRRLLAHYISHRRAAKAAAIYAHLGGRSPLLPETQNQAAALQALLGDQYKVLIAMRYWHPMTEQAVTQARQWGADRVILLPLYPQFSTATTRSSVHEWQVWCDRAGWQVPTQTICCYPTQAGLVEAYADLIAPRLDLARAKGSPRILFSAHGLPQRVVDKGDPYPDQVQMTAQAIMDRLGLHQSDWLVCYQSRVGPMKWIGPSTDAELRRAGHDRVPVVLVPVAFVSEHSETLVELDIEYAEQARHLGIPAYHRVPTVSCHGAFIQGLADLVTQSIAPCHCQKGSCV